MKTTLFGFLLVGILLSVPATGQSTWQPPRTPWGDPDLQGIWNNGTLTPLERPPALAGKLFWTDAEAAEIERNGLQPLLKIFAAEVPLSGEIDYFELGKVVRSRRTSQVVDPADGRIPYTPEGKRRWEALPSPLRSEAAGIRIETNSWEDRHVGERCITTSVGGGVGVLLPIPFYNNNHHIFQARGYVAILSEMMHEFRIIPIGRTASSGPLQWVGNSRGHWEGHTLIVETTNFNGRNVFQGTTTALRLVERFTRVDATTVDYQLTVTDPATFTRPWTLVNTLRMTAGPVYEYACHEDNYGLVGILAGARAEEKGR